MNIFKETWESYLKEIDFPHEHNRMRPNVECRAAFANACSHFFHNDDIGRIWNKDRTTVYHYIRSHPTYYQYSRNYRDWFNAATEIVTEKVHLFDLNDLSEKGKNKVGIHHQIDSINDTIKILQGVLGNIESRVRTSKPSSSLSNKRQGSIRDDERHLGNEVVYRLLRDEQFQVSDESGQEVGSDDGAGYAEGGVVRGESEAVE